MRQPTCNSYSVPEGTLTIRVRELLKSVNQMGMFRMAEATGLAYSWIDTVRTGKSKDPSASRIQVAYEYLTKTKLEIK